MQIATVFMSATLACLVVSQPGCSGPAPGDDPDGSISPVCCPIQQPTCDCFQLGGTRVDGVCPTICDATPDSWVEGVDENGCAILESVGGSDACFPGIASAGTVGLMDTTVSNPGFEYRGASVSIRYLDGQTADVSPVLGSDPPGFGECTVWMYQVGVDEPPPPVNEGEVTIDDTLSPIGACQWQVLTRAYECSNGAGLLGPGATITNPDIDGRVTLTAPGAFLAQNGMAHDMVGARLRVEGFAEADNNGLFAVLAQDLAGDAVTLLHPGATAETLAQDGSYTIVTGTGPTPADRVFLDENTVAAVAKSEGPTVPAFTAAVDVESRQLALATDSALPHALPVSPPSTAGFSCAGAMGGDCGYAGGLIMGLMLTGRTTDAALAGLGPGEMPAPTARWARFECRSSPGSTRVELSDQAIQALLDTGATRIETRLRNVTTMEFAPNTAIIPGHELVGYTDLPSP